MLAFVDPLLLAPSPSCNVPPLTVTPLKLLAPARIIVPLLAAASVRSLEYGGWTVNDPRTLRVTLGAMVKVAAAFPMTMLTASIVELAVTLIGELNHQLPQPPLGFAVLLSVPPASVKPLILQVTPSDMVKRPPALMVNGTLPMQLS